MGRFSAVLALVFAACGCNVELPGPTVFVATQGWDDRNRSFVVEGAKVWEVVGFEVVEDDDAEIVVTVVRGDVPEGKAAVATGSRIVVARELDGWDLEGTVAHEMGHALMVLPHLPPGEGLMSSPHVGTKPSAADLELACRVAGRCEVYR